MALNKQITRNEIFSQKKLTKFSCTFQPFHCAKLKIHRDNPEARGCDIFMHKMANFLWANIFWLKALILLSSTYWHFSLSKILKKFLEQIQLWGCTTFLDSQWSIYPKQELFWKKNINIIFIYLLASFQNGPFAQMRIFSTKLVLFHKTCLVPSIHAYLHAKNQSQILIY